MWYCSKVDKMPAKRRLILFMRRFQSRMNRLLTIAQNKSDLESVVKSKSLWSITPVVIGGDGGDEATLTYILVHGINAKIKNVNKNDEHAVYTRTSVVARYNVSVGPQFTQAIYNIQIRCHIGNSRLYFSEFIYQCKKFTLTSHNRFGQSVLFNRKWHCRRSHPVRQHKCGICGLRAGILRMMLLKLQSIRFVENRRWWFSRNNDNDNTGK